MPKTQPSRRMPKVAGFRCTPQELDALKARADRLGLTGVSELLRRLAFPEDGDDVVTGPTLRTRSVR